MALQCASPGGLVETDCCPLTAPPPPWKLRSSRSGLGIESVSLTPSQVVADAASPQATWHQMALRWETRAGSVTGAVGVSRDMYLVLSPGCPPGAEPKLFSSCLPRPTSRGGALGSKHFTPTIPACRARSRAVEIQS